MNNGQRVKITGHYGGAHDMTGTIVGLGTMMVVGAPLAVYLISLDKGIWSEDRKVWIDHLPIARNALTPIE